MSEPVTFFFLWAIKVVVSFDWASDVVGCVRRSVSSVLFIVIILPLIYMVRYAIIQHFDQKLQKTENFYLATIFNVKHFDSSYISIFFAEGLGCQKIQVSALWCNLG